MVAIELEPAPERKSAGEPHAIVGRRISQEALKRLHDLHERYLRGVPNGWCIVMKECDLSGLDFRNLNFSHGHFIGCDFSGANLEDSRFAGANLFSAQFDRANLTRTNFTRADLRGAQFENAELEGARLDGADLRGASLVRLEGYLEASWIGVDMRDIDFTGAYLCRRFIMDQNYIAEFRRQTRYSELIYRIWWITSDCGRSMVRWGACIGALVLAFAWMFAGVDVAYGAHETALSPIYFSVVTLTTLGYGDALPASPTAQVIAMVEVLFGYVMLGGLLSIISNKMVRRAE